jgi:16S rRNA (guanine527-N7)-methyltransferase
MLTKIFKYFPDLSESQKIQLLELPNIYKEWNEKINVISRKDIEEIETHHILHSMAIDKIIRFTPNSKILDVGTGGGFPGIPLAILNPESNFLLIDSIGKKINVVNKVIEALGLTNTKALQTRVESLNEKFDFVVSRAVTAFPAFYEMCKKNIATQSVNTKPNGIIYLKGGDFSEEIKEFKKIEIINITDFFIEDFFETKKIIFLPYKA